jgi:hypothetical protein
MHPTHDPSILRSYKLSAPRSVQEDDGLSPYQSRCKPMEARMHLRTQATNVSPRWPDLSSHRYRSTYTRWPPPNHHPLHHRPPSSLRPELQRRLAPTSLLLTYPRTFQPADNGSLNPQRPKSREPRCSWWAVECIYAKTVLAV